MRLGSQEARMEAMAALLVLMVVGLRMAEVLRNILVVLMFSANLTLVAMCSVMAVMGMGSKMLAARFAIFTLFFETPPAFGLFGAEALGSLEIDLAMVLTLSCFDGYWPWGLGRVP